MIQRMEIKVLLLSIMTLLTVCKTGHSSFFVEVFSPEKKRITKGYSKINSYLLIDLPKETKENFVYYGISILSLTLDGTRLLYPTNIISLEKFEDKAYSYKNACTYWFPLEAGKNEILLDIVYPNSSSSLFMANYELVKKFQFSEFEEKVYVKPFLEFGNRDSSYLLKIRENPSENRILSCKTPEKMLICQEPKN